MPPITQFTCVRSRSGVATASSARLGHQDDDAMVDASHKVGASVYGHASPLALADQGTLVDLTRTEWMEALSQASIRHSSTLGSAHRRHLDH